MKIIDHTEKEILDIVEPLAEHTENAWNQKNYDGFCHYFLEESPE